MKKILSVLVLFAAACPFAWAADQDHTSDAFENHRMQKRFGIYTGFFTDPVSEIPLDFAYNILPFMRLNIGVGYTSFKIFDEESIFSTAGGLKLLYPDWNFSPIVGINAGYYHHRVKSTSGGWTTPPTSSTTTHDGVYGYASLGFDYQAKNGFDVGLAANWIFGMLYPAPGLTLGWFF